MWKKILAYLVFSIVAAGLLSVFTKTEVDSGILNTLYTVASVIFSVGMSIAISAKTDQVTKESNRKLIRSSYMTVRNSFMLLFGISTILYIAAQAYTISKYPAVLDILCAIFLLMSIVYYIFNFIKLHKLGDDIEDQILKEANLEEGKTKER